MRKGRRSLLRILAVVLPGVAFVLFWTTRAQPEPGVTRDAFRYLRPGMSQATVEALLGGPAKNPGRDASDVSVWSCGERSIHLGFDEKGKLKEAAYRAGDGPTETLSDGAWIRICAWINGLID